VKIVAVKPRTAFRSEYPYRVDETPTVMSGNEEFQPTIVAVTFTRSKEREPWSILWITAKGPRYLKSGRLGVQSLDRAWDGRDWDRRRSSVDTWIACIVVKAHAVAEADRLGYTPPCPACGGPSILPDPANPDEDSLFCRECVMHFQAA